MLSFLYSSLIFSLLCLVLKTVSSCSLFGTHFFSLSTCCSAVLLLLQFMTWIRLKLIYDKSTYVFFLFCFCYFCFNWLRMLFVFTETWHIFIDFVSLIHNDSIHDSQNRLSGSQCESWHDKLLALLCSITFSCHWRQFLFFIYFYLNICNSMNFLFDIW